MISINLAPVEELEDPLWWVPDALVVSLVLLMTYGFVYLYLDQTRERIVELQQSSAQIQSEINAIQPEVNRYNDLSAKINNLESKKRSLQRITESKLVRYLPVVLLEHLQTLKPDGLWFKSIAFVEPALRTNSQGATGDETESQDSQNTQPAANLFDNRGGEYPVTIEVTGNAFDNIIIAEFMTSLSSTQMQTFDKSDIRSQLFFSDVGLSFSEVRRQPGEIGNVTPILEFQLSLKFKERTSENQGFNEKVADYIRELKNWKRASR